MICFLEVVHSDIFSTHQIFIGIYVVLHGKQENHFVSSCESKTHFFFYFLGWGRKVQFLSLTDYKSTNSILTMYFLIVS